MKTKIIVCVMLIILVICGVFWFNKEDEITNEVSNVLNENVVNFMQNTIENNIINEVIENTQSTENVISNEIANSITQNVVVQDNLISSPEKNAYESETNVGTTDSKQIAINLVKEYWGEDDTVTFTCDSVTSNGEYIIAVNSKKTASVNGYYKVNIEKKTVEVYY